MNQEQQLKTVENLAIVLDMAGQDMSEPAMEMIASELSAYDFNAVQMAIRKCARECKYKITLSEIISRIDDGRPAPEIAWSQVPKSEYESMVLTSEQNKALCFVSSMIDQGELIPARMAFLEKYKELVTEARANHDPVVYELAGGWDKQSRFDALKLAIQDGRMSEQRAIAYLPEYEPEFKDLPMLESEKSNAKLIEGMAKQIGVSS